MHSRIEITAGPTFHLRGCGFSYCIRVVDDRFLSHVYWGAPLTPGEECPEAPAGGKLPGTSPYMTTLPGRSSSSAETFSPDLLSREYPSWGTGELRAPAWIVRRSDGSRAGALEYRGHALLQGPRPAAEDARPAAVDLSPTDADPRPTGLPWIKLGSVETEPAATNSAAADTNPAAADTNPAAADTNSAATDTNPAAADTNPAAGNLSESNPAESNPAGASPAAAERESVQTLRIDCEDPARGVAISLFYTIMDDIPVLLRWVRIANNGNNPVTVEEAASASVDLPARPLDMITLNGAWTREHHRHRRRIAPGVQQVESRGGASGHQHAPFVALADVDAGEETGRVWAISLLYSGNHRHRVEMDQFGAVRLQAGINPLGFSWPLDPGESFDTPACVLACSSGGFNGLSEQLHRFVRSALIPTAWRDRDRPVVVNTWEAHYFDVNLERVRTLARQGARVGGELLVVDDGWFLRREGDSSSLGDWTPDPRKFPGGLPAAAEAVHREGLRFGLWIEPEMVSPDSDLYRAHPEWVLRIPGRESTLARNQLVLDLSNPEVVDHLAQVITALLESAPIDYVKWDMNRNMSEPGSSAATPDEQGGVMHRYILGLYRLLETVTSRFPDVLIENCAGGGGRFDYGMLAWTAQNWTSDQTDAVERLPIQAGSSLLFPPETMGAHVSAVPNHQVGRMTSPATRILTALAFNYGYEMDLARETEADLALYRRGSALYRENRRFFRTGRFLRLENGPDRFAWAVIAEDGRAMVFCARVSAPANSGRRTLRLPFAEQATRYLVRQIDLYREKPAETAGAVPETAGATPVASEVAGATPEAIGTAPEVAGAASGSPRVIRGSIPGTVLREEGIIVPATGGDYSVFLWELKREGA
jgi:alpha-galactosidase